MRNMLVIFSVLTVVLSAVFGFVLMSDIGHSECPLFQMLGGNCSFDANPLVLISHHLAGIKSLSSAVFMLSPVSVFIAVFYCLVFALIAHFVSFKEGNRAKLYLSKNTNLNILKKIIRWLSIKNKGSLPSFFPGAFSAYAC